MPDEPKKPDPIEDIRAGLGLLFRAAKTAVDELPTDKIEEAVKEGAREVGRALGTVGDVFDEKVLGKKPKHPAPGPTPSPGGQPPPSAAVGAVGTEGGAGTEGRKDAGAKDPGASDSSRPTAPGGSDPKQEN